MYGTDRKFLVIRTQFGVSLAGTVRELSVRDNRKGEDGPSYGHTFVVVIVVTSSERPLVRRLRRSIGD
ncbi:unnamed protein product [Danaus chrysippus]|uniref:(African queen) hypothetical protein n=1 Tax=Danaus chrysippus TaxID=151541 RepID=A0A8J2VV01_9NEOP|nr:unnamed protein product [Danaus chrysippus]